MYQSSLNIEDIAYARENLDESESVMKESILKIQEYLDENPKINARSDARSIVLFLRSCKFNIELTEIKIRNYYKQRAERVEWFTFRDPFRDELSELLTIGVFLPLRQKDEEKRQIVIIRTGAHSPSKHKQNDVFKVGRMILDYLVAKDEMIQVYGIRAIFDMQDVTLGHALQLQPLLVKRLVNSWENYPLGIKKLEFVNAHYGISVVLDIFKSFMSTKMKERISVKRGNPDFKASDNLPVELGGKNSSYASLAHDWKQTLEKNQKWFEKDDKYKSLQ